LSDVIIKKELCEIVDNIYHYTSKFNVKFSHKINLILNEPNLDKHCKCGKQILKIKIYNGKCIGLNGYCSQSCANKYTNYKKSKIFYKEVAKKIAETRRKNGSYVPSENFKNYNKFQKNREKTKKILVKKYGVENAGVLGAYSSKSAEKYIRGFLKSNNIKEENCYFKNGGINGKEYFQVVQFNGVKKYFSYDLVVFDDNKQNIVLVLEYNGPWHYTLTECVNNPQKKSTPYKNSKTIQETYNDDMFKLNTIKTKCPNIYIFWEKQNKIVKFDGSKL
jgi:hypothetical protein